MWQGTTDHEKNNNSSIFFINKMMYADKEGTRNEAKGGVIRRFEGGEEAKKERTMYEYQKR
jgi:hypothetical protein